MTKEKHAGGRPRLYTNNEELSVIVDEYFLTDAYIEIGDNKVFAPTMSGLAIRLGMDRRTLLDYSKQDEFSRTIKNAREKIGEALEKRLYSNNVAGVIFNLKNNFDWKDKKETELSGGLHLTTEQWLDELY